MTEGQSLHRRGLAHVGSPRFCTQMHHGYCEESHTRDERGDDEVHWCVCAETTGEGHKEVEEANQALNAEKEGAGLWTSGGRQRIGELARGHEDTPGVRRR